MPRKFVSQLRNQWMGALALFLVLTGGTAYAVTQIDKNSVKSKHIVDGQVKGVDVAEETLDLGAGEWHEIGVPGEPAFNSTPRCAWGLLGGAYNHPAFARDPAGFVHLKGMASAVDIPGPFPCGSGSDSAIFYLPAGYRPASVEYQATLSTGKLGGVRVMPAGGDAETSAAVWVDGPADDWKGYVSLDGITFRCAPSGQDGCP